MDIQGAARFHKTLRETGSYKTDPGRRRSLLGRFDSWYYFKLVSFILEGSRMAAKGRYDREHWAANSYDVLSLIEDCGGTFDISGMNHPLSIGGPTIFVGNHMSMADSFLLPVILCHINKFAAVLKESLLKYPFFGTMTRACEPITVGRTNPREDLKSVLEQGVAALKNGRSVLLFPSATRSTVFDAKAFNTLGVKLAKKAGAPLTPFALKTDFLQNGRLVKDIGRLERSKTLHFRFGPALSVEGNGKDAQAKIIGFITAALREWDPGSGPKT